MSESTPLRQIFLDTETTGLEHKNGDRIIEIGCVEMINRIPTGRTLQLYINPVGATMSPEAQKVHGITMEFLSDKPQFSQIADQFCDFVRGAELLIHNAPFDEGFLNAELARVGKLPIWQIAVKTTDTYLMAQSLHPKQKNGLDPLCDRHNISRAERVFHGALLDAQLLCDVYLAMTENSSPYIDDAEIAKSERPPIVFVQNRAPGVLFTPSEADVALNEEYMNALETANKKPPVWRLSGLPKPASPKQ